MKLSEYLESVGLSDSEFAERVKIDRSTVSRLRRGQIPTKKAMLAIALETDGAVTANDFYGIAA